MTHGVPLDAQTQIPAAATARNPGRIAQRIVRLDSFGNAVLTAD